MVEATSLVADLTAVLALGTMWAILSLGLNVQWGYTGLFNAGVAAFWAIGAYTAALFATGPSPYDPFGYPRVFGGFDQFFPVIAGLHTSILVGFALAILLPALIAFLIAIPTLRLRADYLAIATLGLAEIIRIFLLGMEPLTGGVFGIFSIPRPITFTEVWMTNTVFFGIALGILLSILIVLERMMRSPWGRLLKAVREDEQAVVAMGKDTYVLKLQAFILGAAVMGAAGWVFAHFAARISPDLTFTPLDTFLVWVMVIIGGSGNNRGAVLGGYIIFGLDAALRRSTTLFPAFLEERVFFLRLMVVGILLILLVIYRPQGVMKEPKEVSREPRIKIGKT